MDRAYYLDNARRLLVILPPKCASSSIKSALSLGNPVSREVAERENDRTTLAVIRHPYDRAVAALYNQLRGDDKQRMLRENISVDPHISPQANWYRGLRIDCWILFERLSEMWERLGFPPLYRINRGKLRPKDWREAPIDWSEFDPLYANDMKLWEAAHAFV